MLKNSVRTAVFAAALIASATSHAVTILDTLSSRNVLVQGGAWTESAYSPSTAGQHASLVQVVSPALLTKIEWTGINSASKQAFTLCIYSDAGAGPHKVLAQKTLLARVTKKVTIPGTTSTDVYHAASVSLGASLQPGKYWFAVLGPNRFGIGLDAPDSLTGAGGALRLSANEPWQVVNDGVGFYDGRGASLRVTGLNYDLGKALPPVQSEGACALAPAR